MADMGPKPLGRAPCPSCGDQVLINMDGRLRYHRGRERRPVACPGSRQPARDTGERYPVILCMNCDHPGGQHFDGRCKCGCGEWADGYQGLWTDQMTRQLEAGELTEASHG